ncbi:MAG: TetR/AcrR family transcriptional regulator [Gemmatimonadaceae bacterium]
MTPRPRKVSDDDIFAAAYRAMSRVGPSELTLAEIAEEAGVTAGALVQRFGSRRNLLLALSEGAAHGAADMIRQLRGGQPSALATLREYARCMAQLAASPEAMARNLAYLTIDLGDPDFRRHLVANARATRKELVALVREAIAEGALLEDTDPRRLARTLEVVTGGSLFAWATYQQGSGAKWILEDVDAVLAPYRPKKKRAAR